MLTMMMTAIGLMSGTSLDGVDVALIETDGKQVKGFGPSGYRPYTERERELLRQALMEAVDLPQRDARPGILREAERAVTVAHAEAVAAFTAQNHISCEDIDIVGFHGQTVLHRPAQKLTVQIGDAEALAKAIHIPVMHDFRAADVAAGGQGAPFVPVYHRALAQSLERDGPSSWSISAASPTSPISMAPTPCGLRYRARQCADRRFHVPHQGKRFDCEGRMAAQGRSMRPGSRGRCSIRSSGRRPNRSTATISPRWRCARFRRRWRRDTDGPHRLRHRPVVPLLPKRAKSWIVAGGGARNLTMLRMLRERLAPATRRNRRCARLVGRRPRGPGLRFPRGAGFQGLPLSYPATTGVPIPMTGGVIARP